MSILAFLIQTAVVAWLALVQPFLGRRYYQELVRSVATDPLARLRRYRRSIVILWSLTAATALSFLLTSRPWSDLGLRAPLPHRARLWWEFLGIVLAATLLSVLLAWLVPPVRRFYARQLASVKELLPVTGPELWTFGGVAFSAGICEEILARGLLLAYCADFAPSLTRVSAIAITSAIFGFGHLYQGWKGVLLTGAVGALFAYLYIDSGSLLIGMAVHTLIDLRILALAPFLTNAKPTPSPSGTA